MHPTPDYDFIMNSGQKPGKKPVLPAGDSKKTRILIAAGGAIALFVVAIVVVGLISSAGSAGKADLVKAVQQQAEIARISELGVERAKSTSAKNLASTASLSMQSDQALLTAALGKQGIKVSDKEIAQGKNQSNDTLLTNAEQSNKFDEVFIQTLQAELADYQKTLKSAYDAATSKSLKETLSTQFKNAELLATAK